MHFSTGESAMNKWTKPKILRVFVFAKGQEDPHAQEFVDFMSVWKGIPKDWV